MSSDDSEAAAADAGTDADTFVMRSMTFTTKQKKTRCRCS